MMTLDDLQVRVMHILQVEGIVHRRRVLAVAAGEAGFTSALVAVQFVGATGAVLAQVLAAIVDVFRTIRALEAGGA
uniref:Uncharacterized protein n=1 Tax=Romanomermis culicivorax TaxID=13658 RepID=A0A915L4X0_ROMCU